MPCGVDLMKISSAFVMGEDDSIPPPYIHTLPLEILSEIFECGRNMETDASLSCTAITTTAPNPILFEVAVSHTCSYFREVALGNPMLWTSININAASHLQDVHRRIIRSRPCWNEIRIDLALQDPRMEDVEQEAMMDAILPESFRWRSLCVRYIHERADHPMIMRLCDCRAPNLEHLSISVDDVESADASIVNRSIALPHIFQGGTPKLEFIRLRGLAMQLFRPQLDHVVTLHLDQTRSLPLLYSTFRDIVTRSPYLSNLSVYGDIIAPTAWTGHDTLIYLPQLRSLRIYSESGGMYWGLLLGIEAPILESLTLKDVHEPDLDSVWAMANHARYSNLRYLIFTDSDLSSPTYGDMFRTFQQVTEYSAIHLIPSESHLMAMLLNGTTQGANGPHVPWPMLKALCFSFDWYGQDEVIEQVANIRKNLGFPLSKFLLMTDEDVLRQTPWEDFNVGDAIQVEFLSDDHSWPDNGVCLDRDDTLFL